MTNVAFEDVGCLAIAPFDACGAFATCEPAFTNILSTYNESCVCSPGWFHTEEMLLYFLTPDEIAADLGPCNLNPGLLKALYILQLVLSFIVATMQLRMVSKRKQLVRLAPLFLSFILSCILSIYKLSAFHTALIGKDFLATFLYAEICVLIDICTVIFFEKYLLYLFKPLPFSPPNSVATFKQFQKLNHIFLGISGMLYQLIWISVLVADNENKHMQKYAGKIIIRLGQGAVCFQASATLIITNQVLKRFIHDLKELLAAKTALKEIDNKIGQGAGLSSNLEQQIQILELLTQRTRALRRATIIYSTFVALVFGLTAVWEWALLQVTYAVPMFFITWPITSYFAMKANSRRNNKTARKANMTLKMPASKSSAQFSGQLKTISTTRKDLEVENKRVSMVLTNDDAATAAKSEVTEITMLRNVAGELESL